MVLLFLITPGVLKAMESLLDYAAWIDPLSIASASFPYQKPSLEIDPKLREVKNKLKLAMTSQFLVSLRTRNGVRICQTGGWVPRQGGLITAEDIFLCIFSVENSPTDTKLFTDGGTYIPRRLQPPPLLPSGATPDYRS